MTMTETLSLALALLGGLMLGAIFFGGLWWTVRKGVSASQPALLVLHQLDAANDYCPGGFLFCRTRHWKRLLVCLVGFVAARLMVTRFTRPVKEPGHLTQAGSHAS